MDPNNFQQNQNFSSNSNQNSNYAGGGFSTGGYSSPYSSSQTSSNDNSQLSQSQQINPVQQQNPISQVPTQPNYTMPQEQNVTPMQPVGDIQSYMTNPAPVQQALDTPVSQQQQLNENAFGIPVPNQSSSSNNPLPEFQLPQQIQQEAPHFSPDDLKLPEQPVQQEQGMPPQDSLPNVSAVKQMVNEIPQQNFSIKTGTSQLDPARDLAARLPGEGGLDEQDNGVKFTKLDDLLALVVEKRASDLHLGVGHPAFIRIDDKLSAVSARLSADEAKNLINQALTPNQKELLEVNREVDLSYQFQDKGRFRINAYYEKGNIAAAFRLIPNRIRSVTELGVPGTVLDFTRYSQGLFLVTGPTGSGKSTTLAAMIQSINETTPKHIITIEDPIEYIYPPAQALVDQRELGNDTHDWSIALKSALRQDPDVILVGEMRDYETIQAVLTLAETGHMVFGTLHTNSAAQTIDRIIDVFPTHQQAQVRAQLASTIKGIMCQRLVPLIGGGRIAVIELLIVNNAVQNLIRENKIYQIDNIINTSADVGMVSLEKSLVKLVRQGKITLATAQEYAIRPEEILKMMKSASMV